MSPVLIVALVSLALALLGVKAKARFAPGATAVGLFLLGFHIIDVAKSLEDTIPNAPGIGLVAFFLLIFIGTSAYQYVLRQVDPKAARELYY
jgi:hypothetical protein